MAEIRIQEKKRPIWPWILLILIIIAAAILIYIYLDRNNDNNEEYENVPADTTMYNDTLNDGGAYNQPPDDVEQFRAYASGDTMGTFNKEYVANGLNLLAGAVYNIVTMEDTSRNKITTKTDSLISYTQNLSDTTAGNFTREVGKSMNTAYDIISSVQKENYPDLGNDINRMKSAVQSFKTSKTVESQEKIIRDFFRSSASVLSGMINKAKAI